ncbi:sensor histidine kinase [Alicyclobacillaceae bacterium I2511]|nr:sensor histidine kinase [Alicyclobacillaceae bacterium I2511]
MIRKSLVVKTTLAIVGLVLVVVVAMSLSLEPLFHSSLWTSRKGSRETAQVAALLTEAQWLLVVAAAGAVLLAVGLAVLLSYQSVRPLYHMMGVTRRLTKKDYLARVRVDREDELGQLGDSINQLAETLQYLEDSRSKFLADIAHELRTPLSYLHGYSQVLIEGMVQDSAERADYLQIIFDESERLTTLIHNLFELAQADEGNLVIHPKKIDLSQLLKQAVARMGPSAQSKQVTLNFQGPVVCMVWLDEMRIYQVVFNLLDNAIRYTKSKGCVDVRLTDEGEQACLQIADTGIGISAEDLPHVWDRLFRTDPARSRVQGGNGLGLTIVKKIVELHGGQVWMTSVQEQGTVVEIKLPSAGPQQGKEGVK